MAEEALIESDNGNEQRGQGTISEFDPGASRVPIPVVQSCRPMPWQGLVRGAWLSTDFWPKEVGCTQNRKSFPDPVSAVSERMLLRTLRRGLTLENGLPKKSTQED
jgi:hypothetical protein